MFLDLKESWLASTHDQCASPAEKELGSPKFPSFLPSFLSSFFLPVLPLLVFASFLHWNKEHLYICFFPFV